MVIYIFSRLDVDRKKITMFAVAAKIEQPDLPIPQVDTIVSEPIGVLLFHERMASNHR